MSEVVPLLAEAEYQAQIVAAAELCGWLVYHTHDSRRSNPGFPDLILVRGGVMLAIEVKRENGKTTPAQDAWLDALGQILGCTSFVARPSMWAAVLERLR